MQIKNQTSRRHWIVISILVVYATAFAPLVSDDQRNYLAIIVSFVAAVIAFPTIMRRKQSSDAIWIAAIIFHSSVVTFFFGESSDFSTVAYTGLFSITYFLLANSLSKSTLMLEKIINVLKWIIYAYCVTSVAQMFTSLIGLPIPNLILSKGLWSYNSLAVEPSHAGRALAVTMLAYLTLNQPASGAYNLRDLLRNNTRVLVAFITSISLTGSSLAAIATPLVILLSLRARWIATVSALVAASFPFLLAIDLPAMHRAFDFMSALSSMDIMTLAETDHSGALRVMPFLIYIDKANFFSFGFFFGEGISAIARYIQGELIGAGDLVAAGFIPGYNIAFGLLGSFIFISTFIFRFLNTFTLPFIILWIFLFILSAWNSQLFWYGLILLRIIHQLSLTELRNNHYCKKRNTL